MKSLALKILARLEVVAMKPYRAKTPQQLKPKTDAAHRMMRQAYKRRTSSDKTLDHKQAVIYYRKNKSQLKQRHAQSVKRHPKPVHRATSTFVVEDDSGEGYYSYEYQWSDGLCYSLILYGTRFETDSHARRLSLIYGGRVVGIYEAPDDINLPSLPDSSIPKVHETIKEYSSYKTCAVYAGRASTANSFGRKSS